MIAHPHDEIEAFALGSLDDVSARRMLEHADGCPTCAILLAEAMTTAHALESGGERPLIKKTRFADSLPGALGGPLARQPSWMLQVATLAAVVLVIIGSINLIRSMRTSTFTVPVAALVHSHFTHHALHGERGNVKVIQDLNGRWLYLVADGLTPKARYDLFETVHGDRREVGQFVSTASGQATAYWEQAPARIDRLQVIPVDRPSAVLRWP